MREETRFRQGKRTGETRRGIATRILLFAPVLLAPGACSTMNVYSEVMQPDRISGSVRYSWREGTLPGDDYPGLQGEFVEQTIHDAVDAALSSHGFELTEASDADVFVDFHMAASQQYETIITYHADTFSEEKQDFSYTQGVLVVDIVTTSDDALVWRGTASGVVSRQDPEWVRERIREAVTRMFAEFPESGGF